MGTKIYLEQETKSPKLEGDNDYIYELRLPRRRAITSSRQTFITNMRRSKAKQYLHPQYNTQ